MSLRIRVLMAKVGLDGHDRGAKVIARTFRDAGMEVIYTGLHQTPKQVVQIAIQEDVDVIALSVLSGVHMSICKKIIDGLKEANAMDKTIILGGTVLPEDIPMLKELGVAKVFPPGSSIDAGANFLTTLYGNRSGS